METIEVSIDMDQLKLDIFATNFYKKVKNIKALINNFLFFNLLKEKLIVNH